MKITTTRFGELDIDDSRIITFTQEILGFPRCQRYVFLDHDKSSPFRWLQSLDNAGLAFVIIDPVLIAPEYRVEVKKEDIEDLKLTALEQAVVVCIVNITRGCTAVTVNLLGPLIINPEKKLAKQVILFNSTYSIKHPVAAAVRSPKAHAIKQKSQR